MNYRERVTDQELKRKLNASGAVLIKGAKACGKTASAQQLARSVLKADRDEQVELLMQSAPRRLLIGDTPRLIDEWQAQPKLWDYIRHEVDDRQKTGQFILTGSSTPVESAKMHSGVGRFTVVDMRTMSWLELGHSTGAVRMADLFKGQPIDVDDKPTDLEFIVDKLIIGGFPTLLNKNAQQAADLNRGYIELLAEVDMSAVSGVKHDPVRVRSLLRALARNTATLADMTVLEKDIRIHESTGITRPTIYDYLDALNRLMIVEDQPAWNTHIRSSYALRKASKRHFADVSLAVAALGANEDALLNDLKWTGFLFESLATHDLRVYAQAHDAKIYHFRDSSGLEIDSIAQKYNGDWCAFEIKLGAGQVHEAAANLQKLVKVLSQESINKLKSLNIITGTGVSYTRPDGINVISLASLGV